MSAVSSVLPEPLASEGQRASWVAMDVMVKPFCLAPERLTQDDGKEGDHWIDISSAEFSFFKKNGEGWTKLANLRQPARDLRVGPVAGGGGSGGGSAGGGGELQSTRTLPLINGGSTIRKQAQARGLPPVPGEMNDTGRRQPVFLGVPAKRGCNR